jgi:hypothetical protein
MIRNLKALGLALVAMVAFGAFAAQGASAATEHSFRSDTNDTVLTGQIDGSGTHKFTATANVFTECTVATFSGTNAGQIRDTVTVHPKYSSCNLSGGAESNVTVHTGGCNFVFDSDTDVSAAHFSAEEHATAALECESAHSADPHEIEITAPGCRMAFSVTHASSATVNQSIRGIRYTNTTHSGKSTLTVKATARTIAYNVTAGSFCGLIGHGPGTYTNGSYDGLTSVTGYVGSTRDESASSNTTNGFTWNHGAQTNISIETPE